MRTDISNSVPLHRAARDHACDVRGNNTQSKEIPIMTSFKIGDKVTIYGEEGTIYYHPPIDNPCLFDIQLANGEIIPVNQSDISMIEIDQRHRNYLNRRDEIQCPDCGGRGATPCDPNNTDSWTNSRGEWVAPCQACDGSGHRPETFDEWMERL